ncbi:MAG: lipopolysaccharide heptosyltransferase I [Terriglobales bacterium]
MSAPKRILVVRLGAMGDIIHAIPAVALLRSFFPGCEVGWVLEKRWSELLRSRVDAEPLSDQQPLIDFVHEVDTRRWRRELLSAETRREFRSAIHEIRSRKYDVAVDFQGAIKSAVVAKLSGAPQRIGFADPWEKPASLLYTLEVHSDKVHVVQRNFDLLSALATGDSERGMFTLVLPIDPAAVAVERKLAELKLSAPFVVLNPGAGWGAKQWPADRFAEVACTLTEMGIRSLINFGPGEESLARDVERNSGGNAVAAQFTISELISVISRASIFIGGDTGPLHLAALCQVPVVALFGPTDPARTGPYGTRSIVFRDPSSVTSHKRNRETEPGLKNISAQQVIAAARQLLEEGARA